MPKIVCISDTHRQERNLILPEGDILIHAGDFDIYNQNHLGNVIDWFKSLDFKNIIWIAGNHDKFLQHYSAEEINVQLPSNVRYLMNDSIVVNNIKFWGSPFSPVFGQGWAFNGKRDELKELWDTIPSDTDIIITHCNPLGINDVVRGVSQGCLFLRDRLKEIKPKYHISGHIHEGYGIYCDENTIYINASIMDEFYTPCNKPVEIDMKNKLLEEIQEQFDYFPRKIFEYIISCFSTDLNAMRYAFMNIQDPLVLLQATIDARWNKAYKKHNVTCLYALPKKVFNEIENQNQELFIHTWNEVLKFLSTGSNSLSIKEENMLYLMVRTYLIECYGFYDSVDKNRLFWRIK